MKMRHALPVLLTIGVGLAGLADPADARRGGRGDGRAAGGQRKANLTEEQRQARKDRRAERRENMTDEERQAMKARRQERTDARFADLNLTDVQKVKMQAARDRHSTQMQELRDSSERPSHEELKTLREAQRAEIAGILTAEQQAQLAERKARRPEGGKRIGGRGENTDSAAQPE